MVGAIQNWDLHLEGCHSLKDKRAILQSLKAGLRKQLNVAVAEVEHQDLWQRATLGVVTVATDGAHAERELQAVADELERAEPGLITRTVVEHLA